MQDDAISYYNLEDIFFIAVRIEKNGRRFYQTVADHTLDAGRKKDLNYLADEERKHEEIFKQLHEVLRRTKQDASSHVFIQLMELTALANKHAFMTTNPLTVIKQARHPNDIIDFALACERDTIRFFKELQVIVQQRYKDALEVLIQEEESHIVKLTELKRS